MEQQLEFDFVAAMTRARVLEYDAQPNDEDWEGCAEEALSEFQHICNKYNISDEHIERLAFLAKWF